MVRAHQVGAVLAQARQRVGLQDVELPLVVEPHVDAGAVVQAEHAEGLGWRCSGAFIRQLVPDGRRADGMDGAAALPGLVLVGVNLRAVAEVEQDRLKRLHRVVAQDADVDLPARDVLLGEERAGETR